MDDPTAQPRFVLLAAGRWIAAVISVLVAYFANEAIPNAIFPAPFFIAAVMISAQIGGMGPALLAFTLSALIAAQRGLRFELRIEDRTPGVYTGRSLTTQDEERLRKYSSSIIVKGARSPERLLDEVTLFLHQVESTLPPERQRMLRRVRHREAVFEDRSVLVVEDDVRNVFALKSALEPKGMQVSVARTGIEALQELERNPAIELVLMDIMMPEMDGLEATRAIRLQPKWAKLPIIALTAKAMPDDQQRCLQAGANDYIPKPLDVDMLLSLLRVWLSR